VADLAPGVRVRLVKPVDNFPDAFVGEGATGIITRIDEHDGSIWVRLDELVDGLHEWRNELQVWNWPDYPARDVLEAIEGGARE